MEEPPSCHTGISSPAIDWMRGEHCALTPLWPQAIHIQSGFHWYARLAASLIHIECCGSVAGQSWAISKTMGDLQMTGQSVWWEFAQWRRRGWGRRLDTHRKLCPTGLVSSNEQEVHCLDGPGFSCRLGFIWMQTGKWSWLFPTSPNSCRMQVCWRIFFFNV